MLLLLTLEYSNSTAAFVLCASRVLVTSPDEGCFSVACPGLPKPSDHVPAVVVSLWLWSEPSPLALRDNLSTLEYSASIASSCAAMLCAGLATGVGSLSEGSHVESSILSSSSLNASSRALRGVMGSRGEMLGVERGKGLVGGGGMCGGVGGGDRPSSGGGEDDGRMGGGSSSMDKECALDCSPSSFTGLLLSSSIIPLVSMTSRPSSSSSSLDSISLLRGNGVNSGGSDGGSGGLGVPSTSSDP